MFTKKQIRKIVTKTILTILALAALACGVFFGYDYIYPENATKAPVQVAQATATPVVTEAPAEVAVQATATPEPTATPVVTEAPAEVAAQATATPTPVVGEDGDEEVGLDFAVIANNGGSLVSAGQNDEEIILINEAGNATRVIRVGKLSKVNYEDVDTEGERAVIIANDAGVICELYGREGRGSARNARDQYSLEHVEKYWANGNTERLLKNKNLREGYFSGKGENSRVEIDLTDKRVVKIDGMFYLVAENAPKKNNTNPSTPGETTPEPGEPGETNPTTPEPGTAVQQPGSNNGSGSGTTGEPGKPVQQPGSNNTATGSTGVQQPGKVTQPASNVTGSDDVQQPGTGSTGVEQPGKVNQPANGATGSNGVEQPGKVTQPANGSNTATGSNGVQQPGKN